MTRVTPGRLESAVAAASYSARRAAGSGARAGSGSLVIDRMPVGLKPRSTCERFANDRTRRVAPTSSAHATAIWVTRKARDNARALRDSVLVRVIPEDAGAVRVPIHA